MIDITQDEYDKMVALHRNISYTQEEMNFLLYMMHKHVDDKARVCTSCSSSITNFKQRIYGWFLANKEDIERQLLAEQQVSDYKETEKELKNNEDETTTQA